MTPYELDRAMWEQIARALIMIVMAIIKRYNLNIKDPQL